MDPLLPLDVLTHILMQLMPDELLQQCELNSTFKKYCQQAWFWQGYLKTRFNIESKPDNLTWKQVVIFLREVFKTLFKYHIYPSQLYIKYVIWLKFKDFRFNINKIQPNSLVSIGQLEGLIDIEWPPISLPPVVPTNQYPSPCGPFTHIYTKSEVDFYQPVFDYVFQKNIYYTSQGSIIIKYNKDNFDNIRSNGTDGINLQLIEHLGDIFKTHERLLIMMYINTISI